MGGKPCLNGLSTLFDRDFELTGQMAESWRLKWPSNFISNRKFVQLD